MAAKTYRSSNTAVNGFGELIEADATAATVLAGWIVGTSGAGLTASMLWGTEQANALFTSNSTTPKPGTPASGNGYRSTTPISGTFDNANWVFNIAVRSVTAAYTGTGRVRIRVFRSVNADGSAATELTGATQVGTTVGPGSTTVDATSIVTWAPGAAFTFNNEYLFVTVAWETVTASGGTTQDADLRTGQSAAGTRFVTANFTATKIRRQQRMRSEVAIMRSSLR
jgi:hypothetical protein